MITEQNFNGFLAFVFFLAVPVAALLGVIIRARYRKAIENAMMSDSGAPPDMFSVPAAKHPNHSACHFEQVSNHYRPPLRVGLAVRYLLAGLAYSCVTVTSLFLLDGIAFLPVRTLVLVASFATPAFVMAIYVSGMRWYWNVLFFVFWTWLLYVIAPESNDVIGMLVGPAFMLSLVVGNPALRTTANRLSDGLFPMQDYYCRNNSWRPTVLTLMSRAQRVLVDMRGFNETNEGIQFEIEALAERVPAQCITVIVDAGSLESVRLLFKQAWSSARGGPGQSTVKCIVEP